MPIDLLTKLVQKSYKVGPKDYHFASRVLREEIWIMSEGKVSYPLTSLEKSLGLQEFEAPRTYRKSDRLYPHEVTLVLIAVSR